MSNSSLQIESWIYALFYQWKKKSQLNEFYWKDLNQNWIDIGEAF